MAKLSSIDSKADAKGPVIKTMWQFVKFIFVSLIAFFIQFLLLNTLNLIPFISRLYDTPFQWWIFKSEAAAGGLGYFIVATSANLISRIVAFFVNRDKTFNSDANIAIVLPIYIAFAIGLVVFLSWLNPQVKASFVANNGLSDVAAANAATMVCSVIQFFLYFPVDKILFRKEKKNG